MVFFAAAASFYAHYAKWTEGLVPRERGVSGQLIAILCQYDAKIGIICGEWPTRVEAKLVDGECSDFFVGTANHHCYTSQTTSCIVELNHPFHAI